MTARADEFDLGGLRLNAGEGRRIELSVGIDPLELGAERYEVAPERVPVKLEVSRMTGGGYALKLSFVAALTGTCMRCLKTASPQIEVEAREIDKQGEGEETVGGDAEIACHFGTVGDGEGDKIARANFLRGKNGFDFGGWAGLIGQRARGRLRRGLGYGETRQERYACQ